MSDGTKIAWTDATWNPIRARRRDGQPNKAGGGWICQRVSAGCQNCYAAGINRRLGTGFDYDARGVEASDIYLDERILAEPLHWRSPRRVFVCSMTDVFGEWVPDEWIDRMFAVMALTPQHTYQVLTKRPERMREYITQEPYGAAERIWDQAAGRDTGREWPGWPLPNVWLGVSVENQWVADRRIPVLLDTPAAVRWLSCEPLLGRVDLRLDEEELCGPGPDDSRRTRTGPNGLHWVIVGGESGPGARPFDIEWARSVVRQCQAAGVAVFVKQVGASNRCPHDRKGGHFECFPPDLRVREYPEVGR